MDSSLDGHRTLVVALAELTKQQKRLSVALSRIHKATLNPPQIGVCNISSECCVCQAREQLAQVTKLIAHYKAALQGSIAFGAAPSLALGVASKKSASVRGVAAELEAALLFMKDTETQWCGWRHSGSVATSSSEIIYANPVGKDSLNSRMLLGLEEGVEKIQEVDLIVSSPQQWTVCGFEAVPRILKCLTSRPLWYAALRVSGKGIQVHLADMLLSKCILCTYVTTIRNTNWKKHV